MIGGRTVRALAVAAVLVPVVAAAAAAAGVEAGATSAGVAYEGDDRAVVRLAPALVAAVEGYENAGYRLRPGPAPGEATIEVSLAPLASRAPFAPPAGDRPTGEPPETGAAGPDDEVAREALAAVAGAATVHQAVSRVLGAVVRRAAAARGGEAGPGGEGAAAKVPSGGADASGTAAGRPVAVAPRSEPSAGEVARRAVAMLAAVGIEARTVRGRVIGPPRPGAPHGPHLWIEVHYPDRGWAFSDPLHHHHYVPATYLRLAAAGGSAGAAVPEGGVELLERRDRRVAVDVYPAGGPAVGARTNGGEQLAAALRVVVPGVVEGAAVLTAADGTIQRKALLDGEGVFVGLSGGTYTLEVLLPGRPGLRREVRLAPRERSAVVVAGEAAARSRPDAPTPPAGAAAAGTPRPS